MLRIADSLIMSACAIVCTLALGTAHAQTGSAIASEMSGAEIAGPGATSAVVPHGAGIPAGGLLLIPESTNDRVMAFDPVTGDLVNADYIPADSTNLSTPIHAILKGDGSGFLVSDQINDVVQEYDLTGTYVGVFAPTGGVDNSILDNVRGMEMRPNGNLLVTVGGGTNADAVAEFDASGNYLGNFIANGAAGLVSPFDALLRSNDYLVGGITSDQIHSYDLSGAANPDLVAINTFPEQIALAANGNILVANFSGTEEGVVEYTPTGTLVGIYDPATLGGYRGVYELGNGNLLTTNGSGVHEIDRSGNLVETKISGVSSRFIEYVAPQNDCTNLADVPWLSTDPISGTTAAGLGTDVDVTFDSTGLAGGVYNANLCITSNDPDAGPGNGTDLVVVPVELTVEEPPEPPNIDVSPLSLSSSQETNTTTNQPLIVANTGGGTLDWTIDEEAVILPSAPGAAPRSAAAADTGSRDGSAGGPAPIVYNSPADFSEGFDDITLLPGQGWFFQNNSEPLGVTDWFQGNDGVFPSQAGATTAYIAANFNNSGSPGTISNWMLTPEMSMSDGDTLSFWTRTVTGSTFPDRLQVRLSTAGSSTNVGVGANDVGDFTTLLLDINPSLLQGGYPDDWAQYTITLSGLPGGMADGRVAWRYFVTDAGPTGANSNYIGIDTVEYVAGMAEPCTALADIPWLSVSPANGSNGGGTNTNVTATFDSTGLADGVYTGNLCITSNDPDAGPGNGTDLVIVPVTLTVRPPTAVVVTNLAAESADLPAGGTAAAVSAFLAALLTVVVVSYRQRRQRR